MSEESKLASAITAAEERGRNAERIAIFKRIWMHHETSCVALAAMAKDNPHARAILQAVINTTAHDMRLAAGPNDMSATFSYLEELVKESQ